MLPTAYEFHWDIGHVFFLGIFYCVVTAVFAGLGVAAYHWLKDLGRQRAVAIEWEEDFHDLPRERRHCRHEFDGTVANRICNHGFDCETCSQHSAFAAERGKTGITAAPVGLDVSDDRLFHRGHTWVQPCSDGSMTVGMDEFAGRCFGQPDRMMLPAIGRFLRAGERSVAVERGSLRARVLAPVSGEVMAWGTLSDDWLYRIRPAETGGQLENLLQGDEARMWMLRELEWLQKLLSSPDGVQTLADGGTPVGDLVQAYPRADWDDIWGQVTLEA